MTETQLMSESFKTREEWLVAAADTFRPWFDKEETPLPDKVRLSVGYAKGAKTNTIGWCYRQNAAEDQIHQIYISPSLTDPIQVLATELHELCHAATDGHGHDRVFGKIARALGLTGKLTATSPSDELQLRLAEVALELGVYPHSKLLTTTTYKGKHDRYQTKLRCQTCEFDIPSVSRKKLYEFGAPEHCGAEMVEPE